MYLNSLNLFVKNLTKTKLFEKIGGDFQISEIMNKKTIRNEVVYREHFVLR